MLAVAACGADTTQPNPTADPLPGTPAAAATANTWIYKADMPGVARWRFATATVRNAAGQSVLYAIGGCNASGGSRNTVKAYNAITNTWVGRAQLPALRCAPNGAGVIDGKIYVTGGYYRQAATANLYLYNPATNTWIEKATMPVGGGTAEGVTDVLNRRLYVYTDCQDIRHCDSYGPRFLRYNPDTDRWTVLAKPKFDHQAGVGGFIGGKFYLMGGFDVTDIEMYDPATNQWTTVGSLPLLRQSAASAMLGGQLYMIGGSERINDDSVAVIARVNAYDPVTKRWSVKAPLPTPMAGVVAGRVSGPDGRTRIEVVGGYEPGNNLQYIP
jgi:N-acetylneuraminic acid mutarotase